MQVAKESGLVGCADPGESEAIPPVTFLIFGGGALYEHVRERIERERITNVKLFPLLPEERAGEVYSLGDVALIPLKAGTLRFAMPSKTWTAMAAGRPLIVTAEADSAWAKAVEGAGCGWVCPPEDADALAACIRTAYSSRATLPVLSDNARRFATKALSRRDSTDRYFEVLTKEQ